MEEELMQCTKCGEWLPQSKLELMKTGTRRRVCNHCKWLYYVKPARDRAWLRELEQRHARRSTNEKNFAKSGGFLKFLLYLCHVIDELLPNNKAL